MIYYFKAVDVVPYFAYLRLTKLMVPKYHKVMLFIVASLTILFTAATTSMLLLSENELSTILITISGYMLFLIQMITAAKVYKRHYKNGVMPILNPNILRKRQKYGKVLFILLADVVNARFIAMVIVMIVIHNHLFDLCWWLYMATLLILLATRVYFGDIIWYRYGAFIATDPTSLKPQPLATKPDGPVVEKK